MKDTKNISIYVNDLLDRIMETVDPVENYHEIRNYRETLLEDLNLDPRKIETLEIIQALYLSQYKHLYQDVSLHDLANVVFLEKLEIQPDFEDKPWFKNMLLGLVSAGNIDGLFNNEPIEFEKDNHGIKLNNIKKYFVASEKHQIAEIKGNMATFIEYYYQTEEGKAFIDDYAKISKKAAKSKDNSLEKEFFHTLIEKMNDCSLYRRMDLTEDGSLYVYSGGSGDLDGYFIMVNNKMNITFNVSSTISSAMSQEKDSVLRHAITAKLISDAIAIEIDHEANMTAPYGQNNDKDYLIKKDRVDVLNIRINSGSQSEFYYQAVCKHLKRIGIDVNTDYDQSQISSGHAIKHLIRDINALKSAEIINATLKDFGGITGDKLTEYFETNYNLNTHFVSKVTNVSHKSPFPDSELKEKMDSLNIKITDFRAFLQISALKEYFLANNIDKENMDGFKRDAVDRFFDTILIRRLFDVESQDRINQVGYLNDMESLIINEFVLNSEDKINQNLKLLNADDKIHITNYLRFMLVDKTGKDYLDEKIKKLGVENSDPNVIVKISKVYDSLYREMIILEEAEKQKSEKLAAELKTEQETKRADNETKRANAAEALLKKTKEDHEASLEEIKKQARKELLEELQNERERNKEAVVKLKEDLDKPETVSKKGANKLNQDDGVDRSKQVIDLENIEKEKNSVKSNHKNVTTPTIKKKL